MRDAHQHDDGPVVDVRCGESGLGLNRMFWASHHGTNIANIEIRYLAHQLLIL